MLGKTETEQGDYTAAINFDRLQYHPKKGYIIFEYLRTHERQSVSPWESHPKHYWKQNPMKFIALWRAALKLEARLYLVNYAVKDTEHEDKIKVIRVMDMDEKGIIDERIKYMSRKEFSDWFRLLNKECLNA
jgi:hypothetical protein